jgi:hypothetical protein
VQFPSPSDAPFAFAIQPNEPDVAEPQFVIDIAIHLGEPAPAKFPSPSDAPFAFAILPSEPDVPGLLCHNLPAFSIVHCEDVLHADVPLPHISLAIP